MKKQLVYGTGGMETMERALGSCGDGFWATSSVWRRGSSPSLAPALTLWCVGLTISCTSVYKFHAGVLCYVHFDMIKL